MKRRRRGVQPLSKRGKRQFELLGEVATLAATTLVVSVFLLTSLDKLLITSGQYASVIASVLVDLTNGDRGSQSLHSLTVNPTLVKAAQAKADDMAAKSYFSHVSPDGKDSWHWFKEVDYKFSYAGENLAVDFSDSGDVERAWMNSPTHRKNVLDPHFTEIGIATASGYFQGHPTVFVVQMFGTPAAPSSRTQAPITEVPINPAEPAIAQVESPQNVLGASEPERATAEKGTKVAQESATTPAVKYASRVEKSIASPKSTMWWVYYLFAAMLLAALAIETGLELKWHHRRKAAAAGFVMALMAALFFVTDAYVFGKPSLDGDGQTASAAQAL